MKIVGQMSWPNVQVRVVTGDGRSEVDIRSYLRKRDVDRKVEIASDSADSCRAQGNHGAMTSFITHLTHTMSCCLGSMDLTPSNKVLFMTLRHIPDDDFDPFVAPPNIICRILKFRGTPGISVVGLVTHPDKVNSEIHIRSKVCSRLSNVRAKKRCQACQEVNHQLKYFTGQYKTPENSSEN